MASVVWAFGLDSQHSCIGWTRRLPVQFGTELPVLVTLCYKLSIVGPEIVIDSL